MPLGEEAFKHRLASKHGRVRIVDMFAGAGGLSLGFLSASKPGTSYDLVFAAESNRLYNRSLNRNHAFLRQAQQLPAMPAFDPCDLLTSAGRSLVDRAIQAAKGVDLLVGGPPCQGFSQSNRNSWSPSNPNNRLVELFLRLAIECRPKAILIENVQGIIWTPRASRAKTAATPVVDHVARKLEAAGYVVYATVLDAAWYGVPQHRNRFFLVALRKELGYRAGSFGEWGPFPMPTHGPGTPARYVTVRDAIADLPCVQNGEDRLLQDHLVPHALLSSNEFLAEMRRFATGDTIEGHVVTKQAEYVLKRYAKVPAGGNWRDIKRLLTTYSRIANTHSNIYRRLTWDEPSVTIGHYRKSMLIHPDQLRGLSLREATRLQSFPDWFELDGALERKISLAQKQQQLANAVSYMLTRAVASFLLNI